MISSRGFPGSSAGKESACNAEDPGSVPGWGRSAGEGIGYPLQYSWVSLMAQMVKNPPAMWETWVGSLGWEEPLEEGMATHSSILARRIPRDRGTWQATVHGVAKSQTRLSNFTFTFTTHIRASLIAQLVKNPPSMPETLVPFLGGEDSLEKQ